MGRVLSLTFDDGPDPVWTPRIVKELGRCHVQATFFMVGERVLANPDLPGDVLAAGHEIELHCHRHRRHTELSERELQEDCQSALAVFENVGVRPRMWRAPWGVCTDASRRVAQAEGLELVGWTIDTHDWRGDQARTMLERASARLADGGAVLMHDALGPGALRSDCENTVGLLGALTAAARAKGLSLRPLSHRSHFVNALGGAVKAEVAA